MPTIRYKGLKAIRPEVLMSQLILYKNSQA